MCSSVQHTFDYYYIQQKGDYLVCEQQGYTMEPGSSSESLVLTFDFGTVYEDRQGESVTYTFQEDGTWEKRWIGRDGKEDTTGQWELLDECLLVVHASDGSGFYELLYLDFEEQTVWVPLLVKSETILPTAQEMPALLE